MKRTAMLLPLALAGCAHTPRIAATPIAPAAQPTFDVFAFFSGSSEGEGRLSKAFSGTVRTQVESSGKVRDGALHLTQRIREGDKPLRTREWVIRRDGPGHYTGTLTDAEGPVTGEVEGNRLHIAFTMKGGLPTDQWLTLSPDGMRAYNVMKVRKFGLTVAVLSEDIRKIGTASTAAR